MRAGHPESADRALIVAFHEDKMVLLRHPHGYRLPTARYEQGEQFEKTLRRELYEQTGALLRASRRLGVLYCGRRLVPVFVGVVERIESPVLKDVVPEVLDLKAAFRRLSFPRKTKEVLIEGALKASKEMKERWMMNDDRQGRQQ